MAASIIEERRRESLCRLARRYPHLVAERDDRSGGHIVRNGNVPGRVELVTATGCTCRYGAAFGVCKHIAAVEATGHDATWRILPGGKA